MQEVEDEKNREKVIKKKELDALDADYVVDSIKLEVLTILHLITAMLRSGKLTNQGAGKSNN